MTFGIMKEREKTDRTNIIDNDTSPFSFILQKLMIISIGINIYASVSKKPLKLNTIDRKFGIIKIEAINNIAH